jgi:hypothetical protein
MPVVNEANHIVLQGVALLRQTHLDIDTVAVFRPKGSIVFVHNGTSCYFRYEESRAIPRNQCRSLTYLTG